MSKIDKMFEAIGLELKHTNKVGWWVDGAFGSMCVGYFNTKEEAVTKAVKEIMAVEAGTTEARAWYKK